MKIVDPFPEVRTLLDSDESEGEEAPSDPIPLFCDAHGKRCTRAAFVLTIEIMAQMCSQTIVDALGRRKFGEHVPRISGSRHLARIDIPTSIIMLVARWGSQVVLKYIAEAPLTALTKLYRQRLAAAMSSESMGSRTGDRQCEHSALSESSITRLLSLHLEAPTRMLQQSAETMEILKADLERHAHQASLMSDELTALRSDMSIAKAALADQVILNIKERRYHRSRAMATTCSRPDLRQAYCGWAFGKQPGAFTILEVEPPQQQELRRCFRCYGY